MGTDHEICPVPSGTAETSHQGFSRPLRDYSDRVTGNPGLASWAAFSRPYGT
jgi:hypothetical protein